MINDSIKNKLLLIHKYESSTGKETLRSCVNTLGVVLLDGEVFWRACNAVTARLLQDCDHAVLGGHHEAGKNTETLF